MFVSDRRRELSLSIDKLSGLTKVPRYRLNRLEQGIESLYNLPYRDACELACALEMSAEEWYNAVYDNKYRIWLKGRNVAHGI